MHFATPRRTVLRILPGWLALAGFLLTLPASGADPIKSPAETLKNETLPPTGTDDPRLAPLDKLLTGFLAETEIPGAALAVTRNGKLVYARGFGYADRAQRTPVQPDSLFRLASLSKPITAVAVLQLVEQGKLKLDERVFQRLGVKPLLSDGPVLSDVKPPDPRLEKITVLQLLQHTAGWDSAKSFDPMFRSVQIAKALDANPPATPVHIIRYMAGQPLDFDPGERYAYSNFGYCLLGRLIETASGQTYARYVQEHLFQPLGVRHIQLGKTLLPGRAQGEVAYYATHDATGPSVFAPDVGQPVPLPYGAWCLESMDSHGGWIGSAMDVVRIAAAFDRPEACPVLNAGSIATMLSCPDGNAGHEADGQRKSVWYGCGWQVRPAGEQGRFSHWHTGSLDGTACLLVHRHDGFNWAVLFNARREKLQEHPGRVIDPLLHKAVDSITVWPERDLFQNIP